MGEKNFTSAPTNASGNFIEPSYLRWTLRLIFIVVFIVGIIGNSVVCVAVIRRKRMRTSNNIFTFNLALCDLLNVVIFLPTQMAAFENNQNWATGNFMCHFTYILVPLCLSASIGTLLAITSDRYRAIAYPMKPRLSGRKVKIILAVIWITSFVICSPLLYVAGIVRPGPGKVYCDETWPDPLYSELYWNFIFVIQYILPLAIIVVLAVLIAVKIRKNNTMKMLPKSSQVIAAAVRQRMKQTSKITNMLVALVILYAICMLPQHVVFLWSKYGDLWNSKYFVYVLRFSNVFPMANSAFNPIAYGTLNKEFKNVFKSFFHCEYGQKTDAGVYKINPNAMNKIRSGKFRLAVYKHTNGNGNASGDGKSGCRKPGPISIESTATNKKLQGRSASEDDGKEMKKTRISNGYTRTLLECDHNWNENKDERQNVFQRETIVDRSNMSRSRSSLTNMKWKEERQMLLDSAMGFEIDRNERVFVNDSDEKNLQTGMKIAAEENTTHFDANVCAGSVFDTKKLHLKENLETQLPILTPDDVENDSFMNCWVEVNKIDQKLLSYISSLQETDL
ncbi:galanin receptor type 1-like [Stylophora pistillata]|uniref:galanin receptor type 1-like n=1 Tax=Stylophora pistillata TaxID=50429 RepID=UPI000C04BAF3|nr:galanin receptor type 1-like [Stylophora pistillata]